MRSAIGEMELDEILHGRARLNALIKGSLQEAAVPWGLEIRRYEITEITVSESAKMISMYVVVMLSSSFFSDSWLIDLCDWISTPAFDNFNCKCIHNSPTIKFELPWINKLQRSVIDVSMC